MRAASDRLAILRGFGLSEYQARIYLALLGLGAASAGAITTAASLPRNRVYETLQGLAEIGLLEILVDEPRRYRALPLTQYVDRWASDLEQQAADARRRAQRVAHAFAPSTDAPSTEEGVTRAIHGRREVLRQLERMLEGARGDVLLQMGSLAPAQLARRVLHASLREGVRLRALVPRSAVAAGGLEPFLERHGTTTLVTDAAPGPCWAVVADGVLLLVRPGTAADEGSASAHDTGLLITSQALVADRVALLEGLAATGTPWRGATLPSPAVRP